MRLWSIHPKYLDSKGLVALWRETLLAQHVLMGKTKGYTNHPQLERFKDHSKPIDAIGYYLLHIYKEAICRGYIFDIKKIQKPVSKVRKIKVADKQVEFEIFHLKNKLQKRDPEKRIELQAITFFEIHPLFTCIKGSIAAWEKI